MSERAPIFILGKSWPLEPPTYWPVISGRGARAYFRLGYYHAALDLARQLAEGKGQLSSAMPVLFLFRHYLELAMKDVFEAAGAFNIQQSDCLFGHDLEKLLLELRKVAGSYDLSCREELGEVALTILEIHRADQRATAFRYAIRRDGDPQLERHGVVDVSMLMVRMASAADFFEHLLDDMVEEERRMDEAIRAAVARDRS
jgi:hypothetical protein